MDILLILRNKQFCLSKFILLCCSQPPQKHRNKIPNLVYDVKRNALPVQAWRGLDNFGKLRLPDFKAMGT